MELLDEVGSERLVSLARIQILIFWREKQCYHVVGVYHVDFTITITHRNFIKIDISLQVKWGRN